MQRVAAWLLPVAQTVLLVGCVLPLSDAGWTWPTWAIVVLRVLGGVCIVAVVPTFLALGPAATPSPVPREEGALVTTGPHAVVRHPVYAELLVGAWLLAWASGRWSGVASAVLLTGLLVAKVQWEERMLRQRFPDYAAYAARVPRWIPRCFRA